MLTANLDSPVKLPCTSFGLWGRSQSKNGKQTSFSTLSTQSTVACSKITCRTHSFTHIHTMLLFYVFFWCFLTIKNTTDASRVRYFAHGHGQVSQGLNHQPSDQWMTCSASYTAATRICADTGRTYKLLKERPGDQELHTGNREFTFNAERCAKSTTFEPLP